MEKRVLIAVSLSFLVLYLWQSLFVRPTPSSTAPSQPAGSVATPQPSNAPARASSAAQQPPIGAAGTDVSSTAAAPVLADSRERDLVVDTDLVRATFTNRGAQLKGWQLKGYRDQQGRPLDLVPSDLPPDHPRPFALRVEDAGLTKRLNEALFRPEPPGPVQINAPTTVTFAYQDSAGLVARKEFRFEPRTYVVVVSAVVEVEGRRLNPTIEGGPGLGDIKSQSGSFMKKQEGILFRGGKVERLASGDLAQQGIHEGEFRFAGIDDHYFLAAVVSPARLRMEYRPLTLPPASGTGESSPQELVAYSVKVADGPSELRFFFGPKDFDVLRSIDPDLVRVIDFGWFDFLVVVLLRWLKWVNGYVGNYGWSIIILTVLINAAMFPLRHKSVVSMRKMQELQPEIKAIQDRYSKLKTTDPARQKMNVEVMNLYRERGVNPASGCVPMLLTMPVLFAFYSLLSQAIEIRGAPFGFWIHDLSQHDPLYITPVLMGVTMVVQQRMTPATADPMQQRMMMMMPVVFTFMFLWAPSGLVLYWLVSNVWAIGQQHLTNRLIGPPAVRVVRPAAERRVKQAGAGRTEAAAKQP